jgi:hypothetical protein
MALTRIQSALTYQSGGGGVLYTFEVVQDQLGNLSVRNIRSPLGLVVDSLTGVPQSVVDDIQTAIGQLGDLVAQTSAVNGILSFAAEASQAVVFATAFQNTNYRVHVTTEDFLTWRIANKTTTGFDIELGSTYTGDVGYDVFV